MPRKPEHTQNSGTAQETRKAVQLIPLDQIDVPHHRERAPAAFQALVTNIRNLGLLHPIKVTREENGRYVLVFGEGRLEAFRALGYGEIPAEVAEGMTSQEILLEWLTENLQRVEMSMRDKALNIKRMIEEYGFTQTQIAERLGLSKSHVNGLYSVARYGSRRLQDSLDRGMVREARAITAKVRDEEAQDEILEVMEEEKVDKRGHRLALIEALPKFPDKETLQNSLQQIRKDIRAYRGLIQVTHSRRARLVPNMELLMQDEQFLELAQSEDISLDWKQEMWKKSSS